jgi:hypothetical protein
MESCASNFELQAKEEKISHINFVLDILGIVLAVTRTGCEMFWPCPMDVGWFLGYNYSYRDRKTEVNHTREVLQIKSQQDRGLVQVVIVWVEQELWQKVAKHHIMWYNCDGIISESPHSTTAMPINYSYLPIMGFSSTKLANSNKTLLSNTIMQSHYIFTSHRLMTL